MPTIALDPSVPNIVSSSKITVPENMFTLGILAPLLATLPLAKGLVRPDGVGRVPALGWNSWNAFGCNINETDFLNAANQIVSLGLQVCTLPSLGSPQHALAYEVFRMPATAMSMSTIAGLSRAVAVRTVKSFQIRQSSRMASPELQTRSTEWA